MNTTLENALEWLRPFVESKAWDFCVVWKLGNDSSRFIEFIGCCCSGSVNGDVKEEKEQTGWFCKDGYYKHQVRTKACEALSKLPSFMSLFSGNQSEAVISTQPRWLTVPNDVETNSSLQSYGTQVLIPVLGGLIELFSLKQIPKDEKIVEFIIAHHNLPLKKESIIENENYSHDSLNEKSEEPFLDENLEYLLPPLSSLIPQIQEHSCLTHTSIERSSSGSIPSTEYPSLDSHSSLLPPRPEPKHKTGKSAGSRKSENNDHCLKQQANSIPDSISKVGKGIGISKFGKICLSKNLLTERNRRRRIEEGLHTLRALVPNISKMNKVAILGDAIEYIGELEMKVKALRDELNEIEEEEIRKRKQEVKTSKLKTTEEGCIMQKKRDYPAHTVKENSEVQLELHQIAQRDFVIKMLCDQKPGGFSRLIHKLDALGFRVVDANITTFRGKVLNILKLEANKKDAQPKTLRESLIKLTETD